MFFRVLFLLVVVGGALGAVGWFKWQQMEAAKGAGFTPPPSTIAATEVIQELRQPSIAAVGSLRADNGVDITSEVSGVIRNIRFESGDRAKRGQVLVELDAEVDRAGLKALTADRELARLEFARAEELLPKKAVSRSEYDQAQVKLRAADARVAEQQAVIDLKTLRAPFSGQLGIRQVDTGQLINPGTPIVTLLQLTPIHADFSLPERHLADIAVDMPVQITTSAWGDERFSGKITAISPGIADGTRSVSVRATFNNADGRLRPGMFAEVQVLQGPPQPVLTVPRTAVSFNTYGDFVYVLEKGEGDELTARRRQVKSGASERGRVAILDGLEEGEQLVRAGLVKLRDGASVQIDNSVQLDDAGVATE